VRNWDAHYSEPDHVDLTPEPLLVEAAEMLLPGRALDLACGTGRNALYLAKLGWHVTAVDSSAVAIDLLRQHGRPVDGHDAQNRRPPDTSGPGGQQYLRHGEPVIDAVLADLETGEFTIQPDTYDLVCDFLYLQRNLFPAIRAGVRPGGVFAAVIHLFGGPPGAGPHNPDFLLHPGELRAAFDGWKVLFYSEGGEPARSRNTARIIARRA
jgi:SAM-dependent methyltransferase